MRSSLDILSISNSAVEVHEIFKCPLPTTQFLGTQCLCPVDLKQSGRFGSRSFPARTVLRDNLALLGGSVLVPMTKLP